MNSDAAGTAAPDVGTRLGDYELLHRIGSDDLTTEFYARMKQGTSLPRVVMLEVCHSAIARDDAFATRFLEQMRTVSRVRHLNLVTPADVRNEGALFVVSDFVDAASVIVFSTAALVSGESIAADVALRVVVDLLSGLNALHSWRDTDGKVPGLVHGDVSPRAVLVGAEGTTKLAGHGWSGLRAIAPGIARESDASRGYHAPELASGGAATPASDVFAASVLLWELLCGRRLYADGTVGTTGTDVTAPSTLVTGLPAKVDAAVHKALDADPTKRFATAMDFSRALETSGAKIALRSSVGVFVSRLAKDPLSKRREIVRQLRASAPRAATAPTAPSVVTPATAPTPVAPAAPAPSGVPMPSVAMPVTAARAPAVAPKAPEPKPVADAEPPPAAATPSHGTPTAVVAPQPAVVSPPMPTAVPLPGRPLRSRTLIGAAPPVAPTSAVVAPPETERVIVAPVEPPHAPPPPPPRPAATADDTGEIDASDIVSLSRVPEAPAAVHHPPPHPPVGAPASAETTGQLDIRDLLPIVERAPAVHPAVAPAVPPTTDTKPVEPAAPMISPAAAPPASDASFEFDIADDALDASAAVVAAPSPAPHVPPAPPAPHVPPAPPAPRSDAFASVPEAAATPPASSPRYRSIEPASLDDEPVLPMQKSSAPLWIGIIAVVAIAGSAGAYFLRSHGAQEPSPPTPITHPTPPATPPVVATQPNPVAASDAAVAIASPPVDAAVAVPAIDDAAVAQAAEHADAAVAQAPEHVDAAVAAATPDAHVEPASSPTPPPDNTVAAGEPAAQPASDESSTTHHHHHHGSQQAATPASTSSHTTSTTQSNSSGSHHTHHAEYRPGGL